MMDDRKLGEVRDIARQMLGNATFAGLDHAERILQIVEDIGQREGADLDVLRVAALLHDIGVPVNKPRHYEIGALMARGILSQLGFTEDEIEPIAHVIEAHSRYGGPDPQTIEGKILQDADAVEYVGAIGLARAFARALESGDYSGDVSELPTLIDGLIERVDGTLHTERGQALVRERITYLRTFQERLQAEMKGTM
jgi:uncharacterized protein